MFDAIDDDDSGELDGLEMRQLIEGLGVVLTDAEFAETIAELASPGESDVTIDVSEIAITFEDFTEWWKQQTDAQGSTSRFAKILRGEEEATSLRGTGEQLMRTTWFDPSRPFKRIWESVVILILLYIGVTLPYRIAFDSVAHGTYYYIAVFYELSLIADVVVNARSAYYDEGNQELITGTWPMFKHYMIKKVGWMDVISSFPFQTLKIDDNPNISSNMKTLQLLRLCQVVRIAKVIRAVSAMQDAFFKIVNDTLGSLSVSVSVYTMRMTKLVTLLATTAHICSCVWYILGKPGDSVLDGLEISAGDIIGMGAASEDWDHDDDGWVMRNYPDRKDDKLFLYLHSFYFIQTTMSTVGYGDLLPVRRGEVMFAMFVQVLGTAIFGYVVGLMGTDVSGLDAHETPMNVKIEFMEAIMDKHKIKKDVRLRVRRQLKADLEAAQIYMVESVLDDFPRDLRRDVTLSVYRKAATSYEMIAGYPADYIAEIVTFMQPYLMVKGETLYKLGTPAEEIFFIDEGSVNITWEDVRVPPKKRLQYSAATIGDACCFGDEGLLCSPVDTVPDRVFMAVARTPGSAYFVKQNRLAKLIYAHPTVGQITKKMIRSKLNRWQKATIAALQGTFEASEVAADEESSQYLYEPHGELPMPQFTEFGQLQKDTPMPTTTSSAKETTSQDEEQAGGASNDDLRADIAKLQKQMDMLMDELVLR
jgi:CRP-like cAMP-binding protein